MPNFLRVMVRGEAAEPPTLVRVIADGNALPVDLAFDVERKRY